MRWIPLLMIVVISFVKQSSTVKLPKRNVLPSDFTGNTVKRIIEGLGLLCEQFEVTTEDGYILNLNRMINPDMEDKKDKGIPVLFVHGLAMHSDSWLLLNKPENNIPVAFLLAGYDVWLGDQRGTIRSRKHLNLSAHSWAFWDFSFHETGVYDLPAFIDFILKKTGHKKLVYVGLSDGGTFYYVMCSEKPSYQEKLYGGILYVPVGEQPPLSSMSFAESIPLMKMTRFVIMETALGIGKLPPFIHEFRQIEYHACRLTRTVMMELNAFVAGRGCKMNPDTFCKQMAHSLGGTSGRTYLHTLQLFGSPGVFKKYDYGIIGNTVKYGSIRPPTYDIQKLKVFTAIYHSDKDIYAPSRVVLPFLEKFQGPKYLCQMKGVCHTFNFMDDRAGKFIEDATDLLLSMTGRTNSTKMESGTCKEIRL